MEGLIGGIYRYCEWIMRFAYINILWILFTILGFIVFGAAPASAAMFAVSRKWVMGNHDTPIFSVFWDTYRKEFVKANLVTFFMFLIGLLLYIDIQLFQQMKNIFAYVISFILMGVLLIYFAACFYLFPLLVHYETKVFQYIKYSFLYAVSYPMHSILMIVGTVIIYFVVTTIPGLLPVLSVGPLSVLIISISYRVFSKKTQHMGIVNVHFANALK
ncbi:YesL family protein [Sporosarcina sp. NPDC096371]|uniref:YesL family protein n=1 Tax=Sporosarcina sp. NPDC096371 TaxID=3364530 RepID=UPI0038282841